jgi:hypothetical protein
MMERMPLYFMQEIQRHNYNILKREESSMDLKE